MKRILMGLAAAVVIAAGGWLGFNLYVQHRAVQEVDAVFEQISAGGAKASHGKVAYDLGTRTLSVDDIAVESATQAQGRVKIASIKAVGVRQPDPARFLADRIEVSGAEMEYNGVIGAAKLNAVYRIPQLTAQNYSGPLRVRSAPASDSLIDLYRVVLDQLVNVTASSIVAPTITVNSSSAAGEAEATYSGLAIRNVNLGKIDATKVDHTVFSLNLQQPGKPDKITAELSNTTTSDFDATALAAVLDPKNASDDSYHRVYRQISTGPYVMTSAQGMSAQIDRFSIDDIALQPSKFRPADIQALLKDQSRPPTPAQAHEMMEGLAGLYEGVRVGKVEIGNLSMTTPKGPAKLNAIRYDQVEFALEGLDVPSPQGQVKMERFALKSFNVANLLRWAAQFSDPARKPALDQFFGMLRVFEGAEIKGLVAPYKTTNKTMSIDTLSLNWGQFVGSIPSKASVVAKMVVPTDPANPALTPLLAGGIDQLALDANLGAAWTETSGDLLLTPATIEIGNMLKARARLALAHVPRGVFSLDQMQAMSQASQIEAGAIELSLTDNGTVDLVVAQFARAQNISHAAARQAIVDSLKASGEQIAAANPDGAAALEAVVRFVETPGQTLLIKLTPIGTVREVQLIRLLKSDPLSALAQFRIEASTGL